MKIQHNIRQSIKEKHITSVRPGVRKHLSQSQRNISKADPWVWAGNPGGNSGRSPSGGRKTNNTRIYAILAVLFILVAFSGCISSDKPKDILEPRENSEAGIKISAAYLPDITDATSFDIRVTAHMDYNDEFENNSYLRDSGGKIYLPLSYEGSRGHHASGILKFPKVDSKRFELVIKDIAGVKERVFRW
jgi:hypothetical protein